ncbi:MAG: hypothetical protein FJW86_05455 [Actinobacteria bacterium]|nr:hypothetical protein [Actinomycetota bacterium]
MTLPQWLAIAAVVLIIGAILWPVYLLLLEDPGWGTRGPLALVISGPAILLGIALLLLAGNLRIRRLDRHRPHSPPQG